MKKLLRNAQKALLYLSLDASGFGICCCFHFFHEPVAKFMELSHPLREYFHFLIETICDIECDSWIAVFVQFCHAFIGRLIAFARIIALSPNLMIELSPSLEFDLVLAKATLELLDNLVDHFLVALMFPY